MHSYDVFDTTVIRLLFHPADMLHLVGMRLRTAGLCEDAFEWANLRIRVEKDLRRAEPSGEVTLGEIYTALSRRLLWSAADEIAALNTEVATELSMIRPVAAIHRDIEEKRTQGRRCVFLSDTYFSARQISGFLAGSGLTVESTDIFASSDFRASKVRGDLYPLVKSKLGPGFCIEHIGDSPAADVRMAELAGLPARLLTLTYPNRYERTLLGGRPAEVPLIRSAIAGAARSARLTAPPQEGHLRIFWDVGAGVMGPFLASYVLYVMLDARKRGIQRLYFVARDGWIMFRMAQGLRRWFGEGPELRYLYGSRQAWHVGSLERTGLTAPPGWLTEGVEFISLNAFLARVALTWDECASACTKVGFSAEGRDAPMGRAAADLVRALISSPEFRSVAVEKAHGCAALAQEYLREQGLLEHRSWALVDIGWHGRMQGSLANIVASGGDDLESRVRGYYLGLSMRARKSVIGQAWSFINEGPGQLAIAVHSNHALAEIMCAAPHATTIGYRRDSDRIAPILGSKVDGAVPELDAQRGGILRFAEELSQACSALGVDADSVFQELKRRAGRCWILFATRPAPAESEAYGSLKFNNEQGENKATVNDDAYRNYREIAPKLDSITMLKVSFLYRLGHMLRFSHWPRGSAMRTYSRSVATLLILAMDTRAKLLCMLKALLNARL